MYATAGPNEYLVLARRGMLTDHGVGGRAFLWPGSSHVCVLATKQECCFAMTQETRDGIPLRFKGTIVYRVTRPELAARQFGFAAGSGHQEIQALLTHLCLGQLRAVVSHMSMADCIEQRETTLTRSIAEPLRRIVLGEETAGEVGGGGWGIELDVVQVAQVYIIDDELRRQLEAEVRDRIRAASELSALRSQEEIEVARAASQRALAKQSLETERQHQEIAREQLRLSQTLEQERIAAEVATRLLRRQKESEALRQELETQRLAVQVKELEVQAEMLAPRARQELRKEILPLEQVGAIAQALGGMFQDTQLTIYGQEMQLVGSLAPLIELLADRLRRALATELAGPRAGQG
ncbi:MAG: hypothetical protein FJ125_01015 [Deltaproteobacteria bacterium]|nr:hypothetical protein [Deltaproteobacteria bacterium]